MHKHTHEFFFSSNSPYSNFYPIEYKLSGHTFTSSEQGFMYGKAILFNDKKHAEQILYSKNPQNAKRLGRQVVGFDQKTWNKNKENIMYDNCYAKFKQNQDILVTLLKTKNKILVEASPTDKIWGIGLAEKDASKTPVKYWPGENLLGSVLMKVRSKLQEEFKNDPSIKKNVNEAPCIPGMLPKANKKKKRKRKNTST